MNGRQRFKLIHWIYLIWFTKNLGSATLPRPNPATVLWTYYNKSKIVATFYIVLPTYVLDRAFTIISLRWILKPYTFHKPGCRFQRHKLCNIQVPAPCPLLSGTPCTMYYRQGTTSSVIRGKAFSLSADRPGIEPSHPVHKYECWPPAQNPEVFPVIL